MPRNYPLSLDDFQYIYSKVPRLCVDLVIKNPDGYLLTLRSKNGWVGQWHLPGGTVYYQESLGDAIQRVAQDELGIEVEVVKQIGHIEYQSEIAERGYGYSISIVYLCKLKTNIIKLDDQVEDHGFFQPPPSNTVIEQKEFLNSLSDRI